MSTAIATPNQSVPRIGRPSSYDPAYCDQMIEYFASRPIGLRTITSTTDADVARNICSEVPTFQGFAKSIGVTHQVLLDWARKHPEFGQARASCKDMQEQFFSEGLTTGLINPAGGIFVAKNMIGWKDKTEIETVSSQDTADMTGMKTALAAMTPAELAQFSALIQAAQARAKSLSEPSE